MSTINNNTNLVESSIVNGGSEYIDFSFAFNDSSFSDRIIHLEIMNDFIEVHPNADSTRHSERRREDIQKDNDLLSDQPDVDDCALHEPQDVEADAMVEVFTAGDEAANLHLDYSAVVKVKTVYVNSAILAVKSSYFYKLFSNGMRESPQKHVPLRIFASEEAPFMELLEFMYNKPLNITSLPRLLDVLLAADKFEVATCKRYCSQVLLNTPMTPESAVLYLELPYTILMDDDVRPLAVAAKNYLIARYKDVTKHQEELMGLPLAGVMVLLSSDELQVASEDEVYDFVLKWAQTQYPRLEERSEILRAKLIPFIRFRYMTCHKLKMVQTCNYFDHKFASKLVFEALYFKAESPHRQRILTAESASTNRLFIERAYKYRPVKVVEFEVPYQQCVVYLDLKQEECANMFPFGRIYSQAFHLGSQRFFLSAHCNMDQQSFYHCFDLFLGMLEKGSASCNVDFEFSVRSKPTLEYIRKYKDNCLLSGESAVGSRNFFATPWTSFMAEDSLFFINGVLHLRAELTIRNKLDLQ
ncbi:BTB/POZ domain-containing protein POB1 [Lathyrus oleraceus]|uniref:Variant 2, Boi protein n=1 Tax=Pisum sativum TaxID=3888 RepID=A0A9D4XRQ5_PEA|nr:BTB/POZ domain-containing protein POB1-like [Pisum sativum]KAI5423900.1 variant 2, Boi protein [Pisum sativum]